MKKDLIDICRNVMERSADYAELMSEADEEISVRFSWVIDAQEEIKADLFNIVRGTFRLADQVDEFILLRQSAEIVIANSPADVYFSHNGKQISRADAEKLICAAEWENDWRNKNIKDKLYILD